MVLTPHSIAGAAIASFFKLNPFTAFFAGFLSHFFLDAVPHWDYKLKSEYKDLENPMNGDLIIGRDFYFDLVKIGFDALLGLSLAVFFFNFGLGVSLEIVLAGVIGALAPDALQFVYTKWRKEPLISLQRTHLLFINFFQKKIESPFWGLSMYCFVVVLFLFLGSLGVFSL